MSKLNRHRIQFLHQGINKKTFADGQKKTSRNLSGLVIGRHRGEVLVGEKLAVRVHRTDANAKPQFSRNGCEKVMGMKS